MTQFEQVAELCTADMLQQRVEGYGRVVELWKRRGLRAEQQTALVNFLLKAQHKNELPTSFQGMVRAETPDLYTRVFEDD